MPEDGTKWNESMDASTLALIREALETARQGLIVPAYKIDAALQAIDADLGSSADEGRMREARE